MINLGLGLAIIIALLLPVAQWMRANRRDARRR